MAWDFLVVIPLLAYLAVIMPFKVSCADCFVASYKLLESMDFPKFFLALLATGSDVFWVRVGLPTAHVYLGALDRPALHI